MPCLSIEDSLLLIFPSLYLLRLPALHLIVQLNKYLWSEEHMEGKLIMSDGNPVVRLWEDPVQGFVLEAGLQVAVDVAVAYA